MHYPKLMKKKEGKKDYEKENLINILKQENQN